LKSELPFCLAAVLIGAAGLAVRALYMRKG